MRRFRFAVVYCHEGRRVVRQCMLHGRPLDGICEMLHRVHEHGIALQSLLFLRDIVAAVLLVPFFSKLVWLVFAEHAGHLPNDVHAVRRKEVDGGLCCRREVADLRDRNLLKEKYALDRVSGFTCRRRA